jgi:hypothetical protein
MLELDPADVPADGFDAHGGGGERDDLILDDQGEDQDEGGGLDLGALDLGPPPEGDE